MIDRISLLLYLLTAVLNLQAQTKIDDIRILTREDSMDCEGMSILIPMAIYDSIEIYLNGKLWLEESISRKELSEAGHSS